MSKKHVRSPETTPEAQWGMAMCLGIDEKDILYDPRELSHMRK
jgi:hypothetical protein